MGQGLGHQGLLADQELPAYQNRHRTLTHRIKRFAQRDPLGYVDSLSEYLNRRGSPTTRVDPLGLVSDLECFNAEAYSRCIRDLCDPELADCLEAAYTSYESDSATNNWLYRRRLARCGESRVCQVALDTWLAIVFLAAEADYASRLGTCLGVQAACRLGCERGATTACQNANDNPCFNGCICDEAAGFKPRGSCCPYP